MGGLAAGGGASGIISMLLPLITSFLKGKSGNDLAGMLNGNQDMLAGLLSQLGSSGALSGLGGLGISGNDPSSIIGSLQPNMRPQPPVVVVPDGMKVVFPGEQQSGFALEKLDPELMKQIQERLSKIEKTLVLDAE
jgi:hypothetical protein